jgi:sugar/nucleoside kinase (ribokinase family)
MQRRSALNADDVSTIGAGDTFIAGMLFGLFRNHEEDVGYGGALSFATQLAGLKVQRDGFDGLSLDVFRDSKT